MLVAWESFTFFRCALIAVHIKHGLSGQRALTIDLSVMSGCGQGHEPTKNFEGSCGSRFLG